MNRIKRFEYVIFGLAMTMRVELVKVVHSGRTGYRVDEIRIDDLTGEITVDSFIYESLPKAENTFKVLVSKWL